MGETERYFGRSGDNIYEEYIQTGWGGRWTRIRTLRLREMGETERYFGRSGDNIYEEYILNGWGGYVGLGFGLGGFEKWERRRDIRTERRQYLRGIHPEWVGRICWTRIRTWGLREMGETERYFGRSGDNVYKEYILTGWGVSRVLVLCKHFLGIDFSIGLSLSVFVVVVVVTSAIQRGICVVTSAIQRGTCVVTSAIQRGIRVDIMGGSGGLRGYRTFGGLWGSRVRPTMSTGRLRGSRVNGRRVAI
jgi:hypothetical protein